MLTPADLGDLLSGVQLAVLATIRADGSVLLSPVWHEWVDGGFQIAVADGDVKLRHIERNPRVTIVVAERELPYRGFEVRGEARIVDQPFAAAMRRIGSRYVGPAAEAAYPDGLPGAVIRIEPGESRGWDFRDDLAAMGVIPG
jgi:PPOX class probable F420-dependent enzyme